MAKKIDVDMLHPESGSGWQRRRSDYAAQFNDEPSMTEQSHRDSCDINVLMARYERTGEVPLGQNGQPFFGDFSGIGSFHDAQNAVRVAEQNFMELPAKVRSRFDNDPGKLLMFLEDPANKVEAQALGLVNLDPIKEAPVASPEPSKS